MSGRITHFYELIINKKKPDSQESKRYVRLAQAVLSASAGKGLILILGLLTAPLTLPYLDVKRYGIYVSLNAILIWMNIADFGLGNGLINKISYCYAKNDKDNAGKYLTSSAFLLSLVSMVILLIYGVINHWIDFSIFLIGNNHELQSETKSAILVAIILFALNLPLSIAQKVYLGYQEAAIGNLWLASGNCLSIIALIACAWNQANIPALLLATYGMQMIGNIGAFIYLSVKKPWLKIELKKFNTQHLIEVFALGKYYFILQIASIVVMQKDSPLIAHFLGPEYVTPYSIIWTLYLFTTIGASLMYAPLLSAYSEAFHNHDNEWVKKTFVRSAIISIMITSILIALLLFFDQKIINIFARKEIIIPPYLSFSLALWSLVSVWMNCISAVLSGAGKIGLQGISSILIGITSVTLTVMFLPVYGSIACVCATLVAYIVWGVLPQTWYALVIMEMPPIKVKII